MGCKAQEVLRSVRWRFCNRGRTERQLLSILAARPLASMHVAKFGPLAWREQHCIAAGEDVLITSTSLPRARAPLSLGGGGSYTTTFVFTVNLLENTDGVLRPPSEDPITLLSGRQPATPSIYADARYIDDVLAF